jgi:hypothetical protein
MTNKLIITGDISSHWAKINFESGQTSVTLMTSYIFDGLANLLIAISLLNKGLKETEATLIDEPNEHIIHFTKPSNNNNLLIRGFTFDHFNSRTLFDRIDHYFQPNFVIETTLKRLTLQIFNLFYQFKELYGLDGYKDRWGQAFPSDKLDDLKNNWC